QRSSGASMRSSPAVMRAQRVTCPSNHRARHLPAFVRALAARFRAALTVIDLVLGALRAAGGARRRADLAQVFEETRTPAHESDGVPAQTGAVAVEPNALGHHLHVGFAQAGVGALLAGLGAARTGVDAGLVLLLGHVGHS